MKKFPSLNNLKELSSIKDNISTKIFYSTFVNKITDEFIEDAPYNIITNIQSTFDEDSYIYTITYGNITNCFGGGLGVFDGNCHIKNIILFLFLYIVWFKMQDSIYININKINEKIGIYIGTSQEVRKDVEDVKYFEVKGRNLPSQATENWDSPTLCSGESLNINRFDGGAAEVKDEFLGTKCREIDRFCEGESKSKDQILVTKCKEIDTKTINKNVNLIVLIIFIILTRNVENAI
jgi:hypothetical protein